MDGVVAVEVVGYSLDGPFRLVGETSFDVESVALGGYCTLDHGHLSLGDLRGN